MDKLLPLDERKAQFADITSKHPNMIPIVISNKKSKDIPDMDSDKFLIPKEYTLHNLYAILRTRLHFEKSVSFYVHFKTGTLYSFDKTMMQIYDAEAENDGFLYLECAIENYMGNNNKFKMRKIKWYRPQQMLPNEIIELAKIHPDTVANDKMRDAIDICQRQINDVGVLINEVLLKKKERLVTLIDNTKQEISMLQQILQTSESLQSTKESKKKQYNDSIKQWQAQINVLKEEAKKLDATIEEKAKEIKEREHSIRTIHKDCESTVNKFDAKKIAAIYKSATKAKGGNPHEMELLTLCTKLFLNKEDVSKADTEQIWKSFDIFISKMKNCNVSEITLPLATSIRNSLNEIYETFDVVKNAKLEAKYNDQYQLARWILIIYSIINSHNAMIDVTAEKQKVAHSIGGGK